MRQFALRHSCSEGCLVYFAVAPLVCTTIRGKGGAGEAAFLANITVNLQSYVGTKRLCQGAQEGVMLPAHITRSPSQLQAQKQMVHHTLNVRLCFIPPHPPRASCFGGSPRPWTARTGRSPATRSDTGKDPGGAKRARPLEALSFSSSSAVMGTESAVSSTITASVSKWNSTCCIISLRCFPWLVLWQILCTPVDSRPALLSSIAVFFRKASQQSCKSVWMCCMYYCTCWWRWAIHPVQTKWFTSSLYLHPVEMDSRSHLALKYILNAPGVNTWDHISPHCSYLVLSVVLTLDLSVSIMKYWTGHSRRTTNMKKWPPNVAWVTLHVLNMSWGGCVHTCVFKLSTWISEAVFWCQVWTRPSKQR